MTELFQRGEINNQIPDRNAHTRFAPVRLENAEREDSPMENANPVKLR